MKKVAFIAYSFPPSRFKGGSIRSEKFVKYLPDFRWTPEVISLRESEEIPNSSGFIRIRSWTPFSRPYNVYSYGWAIHLYFFLRSYLAASKPDLLYVSCPPFPQAVACMLAKRQTGIPLVVDFRDAWSLDPYKEGSRLKKFLYSKVFPTVEKRLLRKCDLFIANTPSMMREYQKKYAFLNDKKITVIPNGFDPDDFLNLAQTSKNTIFTLVYCGRFGVGGRDPNLVFRAVRKYADRGNEIRLKIIGDDSSLIKHVVKKCAVSELVELTGTVSHASAIKAMSSADALLVYQEDTKAPVSAIAGKSFEYLRVGKAILAITPEGDNADLIREYSPNSEVVTDYTVDSICVSLERLYLKFSNPSVVTDSPSKQFIEQYSRRNQSKQLAKQFNMLVENR
jgi:glycosyltransferase involved in cell wall biosynthesis